MNKRISKKHLTEEETMVLNLYRGCDNVEFYKFDAKNEKEAASFTNLLGRSTADTAELSSWSCSEKGKITATSFFDII